MSVRRAFCRPVRDVEPWVLHPTEESGCPDTEGLGGVFYVALGGQSSNRLFLLAPEFCAVTLSPAIINRTTFDNRRFVGKPSRIALLVFPRGVMNVVTAVIIAQRKSQ